MKGDFDHHGFIETNVNEPEPDELHTPPAESRAIVPLTSNGRGAEFYRNQTNFSSDSRLLPQDPEAEKGVLCAFLLMPLQVGAICREKGVTRASFFTRAHADIFDTLMEMWEAQKPIDLITVTNILRGKNQLDQCGGPAFITDLYTLLPTAQLIRPHVEILQEKRAARDFFKLCHDNAAAVLAEPDRVNELLVNHRLVVEQIVDDSVATGLRHKLEERRFDLNNPPPDEPVVFSINGTEISHAGNITTIVAQQKGGKSGCVAAAIASTFAGEGSDCLGWQSANPEGRAVIHIDSEQSRGDHHRLMLRALATAGVESRPPWLFSYCLTGWSCAEMQQSISHIIAVAEATCGGVHSLILDGAADPVRDVNDPKESFAFVGWLQALAIKGGFPVISILHLNPGVDAKSRGHLGSELDRKSEHILHLQKDQDEVTTVTTKWSRHASIPKAQPPRFAWSVEKRRHVSVASGAVEKDDSKRERLETLATECFRNSGGVGLTWEQLHVEIEQKEGCARGTARHRFDAMMDAKIIRKTGGKYQLK